MWQKSYNDSPTLYLVATPIGNLEDITLRALNVLNEVEVIFSEDTRVTSLLLKHYNIKKKLICLEDHNENIVKNKVLNYLKDGFNVAIVSDRGTPIISDPGFKTVRFVIDSGYNVVSLPGPTAFVSALIVSGIAPLPFLFYGFLDSKSGKRRKELQNLKDVNVSIIFYESPHRISTVLNDIYEIFGNRMISISREISKKFESVFRGYLVDIIGESDFIKGEFVIVVDGCKQDRVTDVDYNTVIDNKIKDGCSVTDAIKLVSKEYNVNKNELYNKYHGGKK